MRSNGFALHHGVPPQPWTQAQPSTKKRVLINGLDGLFERVNQRGYEAICDAARSAVFLKPGELLLLNHADSTSYVMERGCAEVRLPGDPVGKSAVIFDNGREVPRQLLEERPPAAVLVAQTFTKLWATEKTFLAALRTREDQQHLQDCERLLKDVRASPPLGSTQIHSSGPALRELVAGPCLGWGL